MLKRLRSFLNPGKLLLAIYSEVTTTRREIRQMNQATLDALANQDVKLNELATSINDANAEIVTELEEIKENVAGFPTGDDPALVARINAQTDKIQAAIDGVKSVQGATSRMSDAFLEPEPDEPE